MTTDGLPVILFVDDEPNVLQGLRRSLYGRRAAWEMLFLPGGGEAIGMLDARRIDAIVCDLRMPDIDGADVLEHAARTQPEAVRFVLSGHADQSLFFRALGAAHQTLTKPCDTASLVRRLDRALAIRRVLPTAALRELVHGLDILPTPSDSYRRLMEQIDSPLSSARSIGDQIEGDLGLTSQLLRAANSAYFALPRTVSTARAAVEMLGVETVRALLTVSQFYIVADVGQAVVTQIRALADRSLLISAAARQIAMAERLSREMVEEAAAAALLCHVGSAVLMLNRPDDYAQMVDAIDSLPGRLAEAERHVFGATHGELAAYLLGLWGFSDTVVAAAVHHHAPSLGTQCCESEDDARLLACVHAGQALAAEAFGPSHFQRHRPGVLDMPFLDGLGLAGRVEAWRSICARLKRD